MKDYLKQHAFIIGSTIVLLLTVICVFQDYGISFDEPRQQDYSEMAYSYYKTGGEDQSAFGYYNMRYYGAAFELAAAALNDIFPLGTYEMRHLLNALVGVAGIIGVYFLGAVLGGPWAGGIALILLFFNPSWFGHMFNNPKDIPFATGYVWVMYCLMKACGQFPKLSWKLIVGFMLVLGLTLGVRVGGVLLVAIVGLASTLYFVFPRLFSTSDKQMTEPLKTRFLWLVISMGIIFLGAYIIMLLCWPWALEAPFTRPLEAIEKMAGFDDWPGTNLLAGTYVDAMNLPRSYLFQYFLVKLPETLLLGLGLSVVSLLVMLPSIKQLPRLKIMQLALLLFSMIFPVSVALLKRSALYDEIRHFLFLIPLICVISGLSLVFLVRMTRSVIIKMILIIPMVILLCLQMITFVRLHPNQYVYYNAIAGGLSGADGNYETDYWANSYKEAVSTLITYFREKDGSEFEEKRYNIWVDGPYLSATYYFPSNFNLVHNEQDADVGFVHTRWELDEKMSGHRIGAVERLGVDLTVIKIFP